MPSCWPSPKCAPLGWALAALRHREEGAQDREFMAWGANVYKVCSSSCGSLVLSLGRRSESRFTSGNQLWDACQADEAKDLISATFCNAYIIGAGDALQLA